MGREAAEMEQLKNAALAAEETSTKCNGRALPRH